MMDWNRIKITGVTDREKPHTIIHVECLRGMFAKNMGLPLYYTNQPSQFGKRISLESTQDLCRSTYWTVFATLGSRPSTAGGRQYITCQKPDTSPSQNLAEWFPAFVRMYTDYVHPWNSDSQIPMLGNGIYVHSQGTSLEGCVSLVVKVNNVLHPLVN